MACNAGPDIIEDGLVLCLDAGNKRSYPGSGNTWYDTSGNGNDGTLTNGASFSEAGGGTIVFDGSNDYVSTAFSGITGQNPRTVSIWYYSDVSQNKNLLGYGTNSNKALWDVLLYGGKVGVHLYSSAAEAGVTYSNTVWQNIIFTYEHPTIKSYLDGSYSNQYTNSSINTGTANNLNIAKGNYSYFYFNGNIATVHMYDRAFTPQEVRQNFEATVGRYT
jgi:hypothetical protein